jgi:hypothetical protein
MFLGGTIVPLFNNKLKRESSCAETDRDTNSTKAIKGIG